MDFDKICINVSEHTEYEENSNHSHYLIEAVLLINVFHLDDITYFNEVIICMYVYVLRATVFNLTINDKYLPLVENHFLCAVSCTVYSVRFVKTFCTAKLKIWFSLVKKCMNVHTVSICKLNLSPPVRIQFPNGPEFRDSCLLSVLHLLWLDD